MLLVDAEAAGRLAELSSGGAVAADKPKALALSRTLEAGAATCSRPALVAEAALDDPSAAAVLGIDGKTACLRVAVALAIAAVRPRPIAAVTLGSALSGFVVSALSCESVALSPFDRTYKWVLATLTETEAVHSHQMPLRH